MAAVTLICVLAAAKLFPSSDARDAIQTSLLSFFEPRDWHSADWNPKKQVVLRPKFVRHPSANYDAKIVSFDDALKELEAYELRNKKYFATEKPSAADEDSKRWFLESKKANAHKIETLRYVRLNVGKNPGRSTILVPEIAQMRFDPRIVVSEKSNRIRIGSTDRDPSLEEGTIYASVAHPFFSPDGRFAIVSMSIPWSMHSADVHFILERKGTAWKIISTSSIFYV